MKPVPVFYDRNFTSYHIKKYDYTYLCVAKLSLAHTFLYGERASRIPMTKRFLVNLGFVAGTAVTVIS